ncbi:hypothetical protein K458DRAFT_390861 [Lentithecium fluviatile CBS 122367]|uniref:Uncharacterized protein n=1 Tax=Lentithecium fluviatile CBS 122367 TaxID=1168545 RepID=A0A6G1IVU8_9PLEO|nr:hypothetical protein K458DRAFT_390861 [Lentithecium fluviatile CBS 122367]
MEHQKHLAGQNGINLKWRSRTHLEGWDFKELATGYDPRPRVATLDSLGYGWVDLTRSIDAVTLFGCGFGDIIIPLKIDKMCPRWKQLPKERYHLAASIFDLNRIRESFGSRRTSSVEPVDGLVWHSPKQSFASCNCQEHKAGRWLVKPFTAHCDPVQVLCPKRSRLFLKIQNPVDLGNSGAVIFGQNQSWPYRWRRGGNRDSEEEEDEEKLEQVPLEAIHELEGPIIRQQMSWESAYSDPDMSTSNRSPQSHESTAEDVPHPLHSAYTGPTTPDESADKSAHELATEAQEDVDTSMWQNERLEYPSPTLNAPNRIDIPEEQQEPAKRMFSERQLVPNRQVHRSGKWAWIAMLPGLLGGIGDGYDDNEMSEIFILCSHLLALMNMFNGRGTLRSLVQGDIDQLDFQDALAPLLSFSLVRIEIGM